MKSNSERGFSLVELMVIVAVVAILGTMAVGAYGSYVKRANRTDATRTMMATAQSLQRCYSQYFSYQAAACPTVAGTVVSAAGYYNVTIATPTATSFTLSATALKAPQTTDTVCKTFTLNSANVQTAQNSSGTDTTVTCWGAVN